MNTERRSLIIFVVVALGLVIAAVWIGQYIASGRISYVQAEAGQIAFISDRDGTAEVWIMDEDGSNPKRLVTREGDERETAFSPEGDWVYYTGQFEGEEYQIGRVRPNGAKDDRLLGIVEGQSHISVSEGAKKICYISNTQVFTANIDGSNPHKMMPSHGDEELGQAGGTEDLPMLRRYSRAKISPTSNTIAAISQGYDNQRTYVSTGIDATTITLFGPDAQPVVAEECSLAWAADGERLAMSASGPPGATYLAIYEPGVVEEADGQIPALGPTVLLLHSEDAAFGIRNIDWSPDGETIVFERISYLEDGDRRPDGIWVVPAGGGPPERIIEGTATNAKFSPDSRFILYQSGPDLMRYEVATGDTLNLTKGKGLNRYASWSPVLED